jgi:hypothetical protein
MVSILVSDFQHYQKFVVDQKFREGATRNSLERKLAKVLSHVVLLAHFWDILVTPTPL